MTSMVQNYSTFVGSYLVVSKIFMRKGVVAKKWCISKLFSLGMARLPSKR